jgi:hypothetical protein
VSAPDAVGALAPGAVWVPCPTCWGQRLILELVASAGGEGDVLIPRSCPACLGIGDVLQP